MNNPSKRFNILIYLLLLAVGGLMIYTFFNGTKSPELSYSEVRSQFLEENVKSFQWKKGILTMELHEPTEDGDEEVRHKLADVDMFHKDLGEIYLQQADEGIIESFEFVQVKQTSWLVSVIPSVLMLGAGCFVLYMLMGRASGGNGAPKFSKANVRVGSGEKKVTFADVAGADEEKEELQEIVDFLRNPEKYRALGARIPKGVLLVGPPGTGKTLIAKAVAGEADVQFLSISGSDFVELYVGVGASRVRDLFEQAKKGAPSIVFIDEIDAVGRHRGSGMGGGHDEREQTLNQLLVEMDGFGSNDGVIVIAATNRHDILDPALLRPGRFDRQIYVNRPDAKGREEILRVHAKEKILSDDVDLKTVAKATGGFTGADLSNLLNEAALKAAKENIPCITMSIIESTILKVLAGPEKRSRVQLARDRRITAYHEAGHAIAMYRLSTQDPVRQITIVPRGNALGMTVSVPEEDRSHWTRNEMREEIVALLGGRVAEALVFDDITTGASNDLKRASNIAHDMVAKYGMSRRIGATSFDNGDEIFVGRNYERTKSYSERTGGEIDDEIRTVVQQAYEQCESILKADFAKLQEVAEYLLANENMSRKQFEACMKGEEIPAEAESFFEAVSREQEAPSEETTEN